MLASDVVVSVPKVGRDNIKIVVTYQSPVAAPVTKDAVLGKLTIALANGWTKDFPLVAQAPVEKLSFFARIPRAFGL